LEHAEYAEKKEVINISSLSPLIQHIKDLQLVSLKQ